MLYFDDISRGSPSVLNTFTILLNQRFLENLTFYGVKICASATDDPEVETNIEDPAVAQRFLNIQVDLEKRNLEDFREKQHPLVKEIMTKRGTLSTAHPLYVTSASDKEGLTTLFSWENLSKLLRLGEKLPHELIEGLFGKKMFNWLYKDISTHLVKLENVDVFTVCLDLCVRAGVPCGTCGVS